MLHRDIKLTTYINICVYDFQMCVYLLRFFSRKTKTNHLDLSNIIDFCQYRNEIIITLRNPMSLLIMTLLIKH